MKKANYDDYYNLANKLGFSLIDTNKNKLRLKCIHNHIFERNYWELIYNGDCPICKKEKKCYEKYLEIKNYCSTTTFKLLSTNYINQFEKLLFRCKEGHEFYKDWKTIKQQGFSCPICNQLNRRGKNNITTPLHEVIAMFESEGYTILDGIDTYLNERSKFLLRCPNGHEFTIDRNHFYNRKQRCPLCQSNVKLTLDFIKEQFLLKANYKIISNVYINSRLNLDYICPNHPNEIQSMSWDNFKQGKRCPSCQYDKMSGENNYLWQGGITEINLYLRGLLDNWKIFSLNKSNFKCLITDINNSKLNIHHAYSFNKIIKEIFLKVNLEIKEKVNEYTKDELIMIEKEFFQRHNILLGIPLHERIHSLYHKLYNYDNTPQQFKEFVTRLRLGEFNDFLRENNLELNINYEVLGDLLK